jgi:pimeloyl-ACP methyl ester carboxylesterase
LVAEQAQSRGTSLSMLKTENALGRVTSLRLTDTPLDRQTELKSEHRVGTVRRRHVLYVEGYDPRGAQTYYQLFQSSCDRFRKAWSVEQTLAPFEIDSDDFAHWSLTTKSANWQVATRYDFLRIERHVRADMRAPTLRQIVRGLGWLIDDVVSGTMWRIFRGSWRFGIHLLCFQGLLLIWLALAVVIGLAAAFLGDSFGQPLALAIIDGLTAAAVAIFALRPFADRWYIGQITSCWATLRRFGRAQPTWLDDTIEAGARHLVAAAAANDTDELVLVGHSTGSVIASAIMTRALALDPDLGRRGTRLVLLTLGAVMPAVALHPAANRMREIIKRLASEPTVAWIECQSRKDVMNFDGFDPVAGVGIRVEKRHNPLLWSVRFKEMVSPTYYQHLRWNFFRMHFQYINAGDRPTAHDYMLLIAGPVAIGDWARHHQHLTLEFIAGDITQSP